MIIRNIILNNYRLYKGENRIDFSQKNEKNIFLISGQNGFGKTTFLHSLIWCLYGKLMTEVEAEIRKDISNNGYNAFLKGNLNNEIKAKVDDLDVQIKEEIRKRGYSPDNEHLKSITQYYVSIDFSDVVIPSLPCTSLKIIRSYDFIQEKECVEILIDGVRNELTNEIGPDVFINDFILNKDIARFFFFDSEQIVALAETNTVSERRKLCSAYNEVLGVRKYEDLKKNLENVRLRFRKRSSDTLSREKLLSLLAKQESLKQALEENIKSRFLLEEEIKKLKNIDNELQMQLMREGNNTTVNEIQKLESIIEATRSKDEEFKKQLKLFLEYAPFAITGGLLHETKVQLEIDYEKQKFNDNQNSRNLIVSQIKTDLFQMINNVELDNSLMANLQSRIDGILSKYMGDLSSEDTLLTMSSNDFEEFISVYNNITTTYRTEFERLAEDYKKNKQVLERNNRKLSNIKSKENDELIKKIRAQKNDIELQISNKERELLSQHESYGTKNQEFSTISKQVSELSKIVSLDDIDVKKDAIAEQVIKELSSFLVSLKQEKKYSLERRIKSILNTLMHKEDFIGNVEVLINGEDMDIELYSNTNLRINKDSLSKGEQQLYATSILKALVDESGIQFPVFIDSPLQKFDKSHATKIITEFYPTISKQVVLFPLLYKELTFEEYQVMKPLINATYLIENDTTQSHFKKININDFIKEDA